MKSWRPFAILGLFLCVGFIAYSGIINSWFLSDDFVQIGKVRAGDLSVVWGREHGGFFRPLFILSYLIDSTIWGARPFGFHLTNVLFHSLNGFGLYVLSLRLVEDLKLTPAAKRMIAIGAATLFLLHPSHTEAVSWISGRADVLATFFCLASLCFYLSYAQSRRLSRLAGSLVCFTLALTAKESAICLPFLVMVLGFFNGSRKDRAAVAQIAVIAPYFLILLAFIVVRAVFIGALVGGYGTGQHLNFSPTWIRDRLLEASVRAVLPVLPSQFAWFLFKPLQSRVFILGSLACAGLVAAAIIFRRRWYGRSHRREQNGFIIALVMCFLFSLLPVINLRLTLYQTQGERFLYLPSVFSCLLMAYLSVVLLRRRKLWLAILICALGFYSIRLYQTNRSWAEAARLSHSITDELVNSATCNHLIILNAPDNLRGVPVFHNGLPESLEYFQVQKQFSQVEVTSFQELQSAQAKVAVNAGPESFSINPLNLKESFARMQSTECVKTTALTKTSLEFYFQPCSANADLFIFNNGSMARLTDRVPFAAAEISYSK